MAPFGNSPGSVSYTALALVISLRYSSTALDPAINSMRTTLAFSMENIPTPSTTPAGQPLATEVPTSLAPLTGAQIRALKGRAQRLDAILRLGRAGMTPAFIQSLDAALASHELVKVKFTDLKDERKSLSRAMADATASHLIWVVGHVAVFFRPRPCERDDSE
jgi:RNA-binding protein